MRIDSGTNPNIELRLAGRNPPKPKRTLRHSRAVSAGSRQERPNRDVDGRGYIAYRRLLQRVGVQLP